MKKTKKGFTLIELLAVIAILAVLAIVAVPSVINMYKDAKQKSFLTQAKNVFQGAESKFMSDQLDTATAGVTRTYCHDAATANDATEVKVDLSGSSVVYYKITFSAAGAVTYFQILDGTYSVTKSSGGTVTDITAVDGTVVTTMTC